MSRDEATLTFLTPERCAAATQKPNADNEVTVALGDAPSQASAARDAL